MEKQDFYMYATGYVGHISPTRFTAKGDQIANIRLGVPRGNATFWVECVFMGDRVDIAKSLHVGQRIAVWGVPDVKAWVKSTEAEDIPMATLRCWVSGLADRSPDPATEPSLEDLVAR